MKKKLGIILAVIIILSIIVILWISGIIPKQIARISATNYLKKNFPKKQYEYVSIEWCQPFGGYSIRFKDEKGEIIGFQMPSKYFPITPGQGTFALSERYRVEYKGHISGIDDFYIHSATKNYKHIRSLPINYSKEQAQKDNCFIVGESVYNDNLYTEFMNKYNNKENAFIRVVQYTIEGDSFIIDLLYEVISDKVYIVKDNTKDRFLAQNDRDITYKTYEKTGIWNYQNSQYWVAYNGELPNDIEDNLGNANNLFIITEINKENKTAQVEFTRTYNVVSNLNKTDATGENNFYVVQQFQLFEPIVIKVNKKYVLQENENYEFTFKGNKIDGKDYTIQDIFNTFDITNIEKTDKVGLEQRQDAISIKTNSLEI